MKRIIGLIAFLLMLCFIGIAWASTFSWDAPTTGDPATGYRLYYYPQSDPSNVQFIDTQSISTSFTSSVVDSLLPDTPYDFYVVAYNSAGEGGPSNIVTYVRPTVVPGACSNFQIN